MSSPRRNSAPAALPFTLALALGLTVSLVAAPARADEDRVLASRLFARALDRSRSGDHAAALRYFQAAYAAAPTANSLYNMGREQQLLGDERAAVESYRRYLAQQRLAPDRPEVEKVLVQLGARPQRTYDLRGEERWRFPRDVVVFRGTVDALDDVISARRVVFAPGARLVVPKGKLLVIIAGTLEVQGAAHIDGRGARGPRGVAGVAPVEWTTAKTKDYEEACRTEVDAGGPGGRGGDGGRGATVIVRYLEWKGRRELLTADVAGGPGGEGGPGGPGRVCIGPDRANQRKTCPAGPPGPPGAQGPAGSFDVKPL